MGIRWSRFSPGVLVFAALWPLAGWFLSEPDEDVAGSLAGALVVFLAFVISTLQSGWDARWMTRSDEPKRKRDASTRDHAVLVGSGALVAVLLMLIHLPFGGAFHPGVVALDVALFPLVTGVAVGMGFIVGFLLLAPLWFLLKLLRGRDEHGRRIDGSDRIEALLAVTLCPAILVLAVSIAGLRSGEPHDHPANRTLNAVDGLATLFQWFDPNNLWLTAAQVSAFVIVAVLVSVVGYSIVLRRRSRRRWVPPGAARRRHSAHDPN